MANDLVTLGVMCADVIARPFTSLPPRGHLGLIDSLTLQFGGLAGVTAIAYSQLGGKAGVIGGVGNDGFGAFLEQTLTSYGVDTSGLLRGDANTSATVVLSSADGERSFLHQVGSTANITEDRIDYDFIGQAKVFHWGGPSVTPGVDGAPMGRIMAKAKALGVRTSMDTCFDGNGRWLALIEPALPHLDIVMSSLEEARHYTGKTEPEDIADFYLSYGPSIALIKLGEDGLFVKSGGEAHHVPAHRVPVVDTTGAGDAACGGFLFGLTQGWDLVRAARLANAVGALTVQQMGGAGAVRSLDDALALMEGVPA